ncbi:hypothetical protein BN59_00816 [Legionella massiliensis]|uniref:Uncharacterized protein n=1 Tax=Legionella massiliensis TaxID=1034943 RepID=A0A078KU82_9GAMM|nr:hypothetical protein [Legionella massiliensis]CDZ76542.1 hypothetical protein BN59_00816 [Legionella massiliensis]CEE12280.1 hypothetical protein BN1094_00816 [Legionella massiliensis]
MKVRKSGIVLILMLCLGFTACKELDQTPTSASGEEAITGTEGEANKPLKINSNKKYVKHRQVNRRVIHRIHRLHRA